MELESLPYLDTPPTESEKALINNLIQSEIVENTNIQHPQVPEIVLNQDFWDNTLIGRYAVQGENKEEGLGIDRSRYLLEESSSKDYTKSLQLAYTLLEYTHGRQESLQQLGQGGRNQWLIANDQAERSILAPLEAEIAYLDSQIQLVNGQRKSNQLEIKDKLHYLENRWRSALDTLLQVNLANLQLASKLDL